MYNTLDMSFFLRRIELDDVRNLEKKLNQCMERILTRQKKLLFLQYTYNYYSSLNINNHHEHNKNVWSKIKSVFSFWKSERNNNLHSLDSLSNTNKFSLPSLSSLTTSSPSSTSSLSSSSSHSILSSPSSTSITQLANNIHSLTSELRQLDELKRVLFNEFHDLRLGIEALRTSNTFLGKIFNLLGYFFSGYCVYKMTMACINIILQRVNQLDPVSRGIQLCLVYFFDLSPVSQYICV